MWYAYTRASDCDDGQGAEGRRSETRRNQKKKKKKGLGTRGGVGGGRASH